MKAITVKKAVLLVEIIRYCPLCEGKNSVALTKTDSSEYQGFECSHCKEWVEDTLSPNDIPDWWPEVNPGGNIS